MSINPYEAPQSSLETEEPRTLPINSERSFIHELFWSAIAGVLLFSATVTGLIIAQRVAIAYGYMHDARIEAMTVKMPWIVLIFIGTSWLLCRKGKRALASLSLLDKVMASRFETY